MTKLELTLTKLRERAVILRQGRWSDGPEDAELMEHAADAIEQLERKNAKLRELVRDACGGGHPDRSCGECDMRDECHAEIEDARRNGNGRWNTRCLFERRIEDRMRELGVEVDG